MHPKHVPIFCETLDKDTYSISSNRFINRSSNENEGNNHSQKMIANNNTVADNINNNNGDPNGPNNRENESKHFFEGAEKRLVIYFKDSKNPKHSKLDLRKINRSQWKNVLDLVHCQILNVISNDYFDAYLLSESSLFVAKRCFLLKTCGSTTLLHCLEQILNIVFDLGFDTIEDVYYSHKNLLLPSLQKKPHNSFLKESEHLDKVFNGHSHLFGHINADRWYLYTAEYDSDMNGQQQILNENEHFKFEMIMEELDENVMRLFYNDANVPTLTATQVTRKAGIDSIIPGMVIDDYLFSPCGYSMNGLLGEYYMTIHITPEPDFSYVSVETNVPQKSYGVFIEKLLDLFKPGKFMLNLFVPSISYLKTKQDLQRVLEPMDNMDHNQNSDLLETAVKVHGLMIYETLSCGLVNCHYRRCDFQMAQSEHLDIFYARYVSKGIS